MTLRRGSKPAPKAASTLGVKGYSLIPTHSVVFLFIYSNETIPPLSTASKVLVNVARTFSFSGYTKRH